jgi:hypothetical protein
VGPGPRTRSGRVPSPPPRARVSRVGAISFHNPGLGFPCGALSACPARGWTPCAIRGTGMHARRPVEKGVTGCIRSWRCGCRFQKAEAGVDQIRRSVGPGAVRPACHRPGAPVGAARRGMMRQPRSGRGAALQKQVLPLPPVPQSPGISDPVCSVSRFRWGRSSTRGGVQGRRAAEGATGGLLGMSDPREGTRAIGSSAGAELARRAQWWFTATGTAGGSGTDRGLASGRRLRGTPGGAAGRRTGLPRHLFCRIDARKRTKWTAPG